MKESPQEPWIHLGDCPVCVDGIVRVRVCEGDCSGKQLYGLCDECEAIWLEPDTATEKHFPDAVNPLCPTCGESIYGERSRWALPQDVKGTAWGEQAIISFPTSDVGEPSDSDDDQSDGSSDQIAARQTADPDQSSEIDDQDQRSAGC